MAEFIKAMNLKAEQMKIVKVIHGLLKEGDKNIRETVLRVIVLLFGQGDEDTKEFLEEKIQEYAEQEELQGILANQLPDLI